MWFIFNRLKLILLSILGAVRRALCCFRRKKIHSDESDENLTHVLVAGRGDRISGEDWDNRWEDDSEKRVPRTIQDHIQLYREKIARSNEPPPPSVETEIVEDLFKELEPQYVTQKRVLVDNSSRRQSNRTDASSRLSVSDNAATSNDLEEWVEEGASGWDEQAVDPMDFFREQKRLKREANKNQSLGRKLKA